MEPDRPLTLGEPIIGQCDDCGRIWSFPYDPDVEFPDCPHCGPDRT